MSDLLGELFEQFIKERIYLKAVSAKTETWYRTAFKAFQSTPGEGLTKQRLQAFVIATRDRGVKPRSVNTYLQALNAFALWLHETHGSDVVHQKLLRTEKRILTTFTDAQLKALLGFKPRLFNEWRIYALACTILDTGCRIEELLTLSAAAVDFDNLLLTVYGKGNKERKIPFSFELRKTLFRYDQYRTRHGFRFDLVFSSRRGTKWRQRNALRSYYLLLKRLGLPHSGFHRLRHTMATQYLKAGGDVVRLSKILGHSQITTTMKYLHLLTEDIQAPHQRLSILSRLR